MLKKIISIALSVVLAFSAIFCLPAESSAESGITGTAAYKAAGYLHWDSLREYVYDDGLFCGDSSRFDPSLAALSCTLCTTTAVRTRESRSLIRRMDPSADQSSHLRAFLGDNGFTDVETRGDYTGLPTGDYPQAACARKTVYDDGKAYTLLVVIPRVGTFGSELSASLKMSGSAGDKGDYAMFADGADRMVSFVRDYIRDKEIKGNVKLWISGYSGSACLMDVFAAKLLRDPYSVLGSSVKFDPKDFYCYLFAPIKTAGISGDWQDSRYDRIHLIYEDYDFVTKLPFDDAFAKYGKRTKAYGPENKERALQLMKTDDPDGYARYISAGDPDKFTPLKVDTDALIRGEFKLVADGDSYLPKEQAGYVDTVIAGMQSFLKESSGDSREEFFRSYQGPLMRLAEYGTADDAEDIIEALKESPYVIPMMISMYMTFMLDRSITERSIDANALIEGSFNRMADIIEEDSGSLGDRFKGLSYYEAIKDRFFTEDSEGSTDRYRLRHRIDAGRRSILLPIAKKLSARLYATALRDVMKKTGADETLIRQMTGMADSEAVSWFMTNLLLGNSAQSSKVKTFSLDNEQFKQAATLIGNAQRLFLPHLANNGIEWIRSVDPYYDDYDRLTAARDAGYRRVYIGKKNGPSIKGTVTDAAGNTVAEFNGDRLTSRTDTWIGMTTCDTGNWLRLPVDKEYAVRIETGGSGRLGVKVGEYSVGSGTVVRSVDSDSGRDWNSISVRKGDVLTLTLPEITAQGSEYSLPSDAEYSLSHRAVKPAIKLGRKAVTLKKGKKYTVRASVVDSYTGEKLSGYKLKYKSGNKKIATVSSRGVIKAEKKGSCKVYIRTVSGVRKTVTVKVK